VTRYPPLWQQANAYAAGIDRRLLSTIWPVAACNGVAVAPSSGMTVQIAPGVVVAPTISTSTPPGSVVCSSDAVEFVTLAAAPGTNSRIDLVVCQPRGTDLDGGPNNDYIFTTVAGTVAASPVAPAVPDGTVAIAQITVAAGTATITAGMISDRRPPRISASAEAALGAAAPLAYFTDTRGDLWIAKGGVNGGAWRRARDVLRARVWRSTSFSFPTTAAGLDFDGSPAKDDYGIYSHASQGFVCPVAGVYRYTCQLCANVTAAGSFVTQMVQSPAGTTLVTRNDYGTGAGNASYSLLTDTLTIAAGALVKTVIQGSASIGGLGYGTSLINWAALEYLGTG
jgi:hypothetical protein